MEWLQRECVYDAICSGYYVIAYSQSSCFDNIDTRNRGCDQDTVFSVRFENHSSGHTIRDQGLLHMVWNVFVANEHSFLRQWRSLMLVGGQIGH